ncbi:unnamed protein product [Brassicogethes aeneus]|uniref:Armadillo repeat-containing protein 7 n=1 Tax=Brassicogethes aeneus TaxID=1431903 RepID=A0A9P0B9A4_BRAAE|nr:unnamed protein product [Brassicogethes aeneus]
MFTRKEVLERKTGEDGIGRYDFLKQLINEFATTKSFLESKKQTLANLSNFAYDPINFVFFKQLHILDLFLAQLSENSEDLINFSLAGLCNLASDPENKEYIISLNGVYLISQYLSHQNIEIKLNSLTTLYYILETQPHLVTQDILNESESFKSSDDPRLSNLGTVFLEKYKHEVSYSSQGV